MSTSSRRKTVALARRCHSPYIFRVSLLARPSSFCIDIYAFGLDTHALMNALAHSPDMHHPTCRSR